MLFRNSSCSGVSTPSINVWVPMRFARSTIDEMIWRERGLLLNSLRKSMSILTTSKAKSFRVLREE